MELFNSARVLHYLNRCNMKMYDGAPCSQLKVKMNREESIKAALKRKNIGVTYFPMEGKWGAYRLSNYQSLAMYSSLEELHAVVTQSFKQSLPSIAKSV